MRILAAPLKEITDAIDERLMSVVNPHNTYEEIAVISRDDLIDILNDHTTGTEIDDCQEWEE